MARDVSSLGTQLIASCFLLAALLCCDSAAAQSIGPAGPASKGSCQCYCGIYLNPPCSEQACKNACGWPSASPANPVEGPAGPPGPVQPPSRDPQHVIDERIGNQIGRFGQDVARQSTQDARVREQTRQFNIDLAIKRQMEQFRPGSATKEESEACVQIPLTDAAAYVVARTTELKKALVRGGSDGWVTMAVAVARDTRDCDHKLISASEGDYLRPDVRLLVPPRIDERVVDGFDHAERNIASFVLSNFWSLEDKPVAATRPICCVCNEVIRKMRGIAVTPVKKECL
jgi:hypothetical protein